MLTNSVFFIGGPVTTIKGHPSVTEEGTVQIHPLFWDRVYIWKKIKIKTVASCLTMQFLPKWYRGCIKPKRLLFFSNKKVFKICSFDLFRSEHLVFYTKNETNHSVKIRKIVLTFEPMMQFWCLSIFRNFLYCVNKIFYGGTSISVLLALAPM